MAVQFVQSYLVALGGLVVGAAAGFWVSRIRGGTPGDLSARLTLTLLAAVGTAHLVLIPVVELERKLMFGLYFASVVVVIAVAVFRWPIWRLGAVLLPLGSILGYAYFAVQVHEVDYIGLAVKVVEVATIAAALTPLFVRHQSRPSVA